VDSVALSERPREQKESTRIKEEQKIIKCKELNRKQSEGEM
jgi:hypothetical protein